MTSMLSKVEPVPGVEAELRFQALQARGAAFLGTDYAIMGGP